MAGAAGATGAVAEDVVLKGDGPSVDLLPEAEALIVEAKELSKSGHLEEALEKLHVLEKRARQVGDSPSGTKLCVAICGLCFAAGDLDRLVEEVQVLSKKRGQFQRATVELVQECMQHLDDVADVEARGALVRHLRAVTEGKIFVEVERARLTLRLAHMLEEEGKIAEASAMLQEVAVETVGSMERGEKVDLLLEQLRLTCAERDFVRMGIIANKVGRRIIDARGMANRRVAFLEAVIPLYLHQRDPAKLRDTYLRMYRTMRNPTEAPEALERENALLKAATGNAKATRKEAAERGDGAGEGKEAEEGDAAMDATPVDEGDLLETSPARLQEVLSYVAVYAVLARSSDESRRALTVLSREPALSRDLPAFFSLVSSFTTQEVIPWPLPAAAEAELRAHPLFEGADETVAAAALGADSETAAALSTADAAGPSANHWWGLLRTRVLQHNVLVLAAYYERARLPHLARMLGLAESELEATIAELVTSKTIWARIDRPARVVQFAKPKAASGVLSDWSADVSKVLTLVERAAHLIQKERMVHEKK